jgi:hypothetical protein
MSMVIKAAERVRLTERLGPEPPDGNRMFRGAGSREEPSYQEAPAAKAARAQREPFDAGRKII